MITAFRSYLDTWVVRGLFVVLVVAFAMWGIGDVLRNVGTTTWVAKVGGTAIEAPQAQEAFRQQLAQVTKILGDKEPTPEIRRSIASQSLDRLIAQTLIAQEAGSLHIGVPPDAVRQAVYQLPAFRGANGQFDQARFEQVLRSNGLNEQHFLDLMRADLSQRQLLEAVRSGAVPPDVLTRAVFDFQDEKRSADMAEVPFATAKPPAEPAEDVLKRWWDNHPDAYRTPEYRRIKLVVLSPQTLAKDIKVTDEDLHAAYDAHRSQLRHAGQTLRRGDLGTGRGPRQAARRDMEGGCRLGQDAEGGPGGRRRRGRAERRDAGRIPLARAGQGRVRRHPGGRRATRSTARSAGTWCA